MSNRPARSLAISGPRATGVGTAITTIITGSLAYGSLRHQWVCFGHHLGGVGETAFMRLTRVTGDQVSVFMEALITALATPEMVTGAGDGMEIPSTTPPR